MAQHNPFMKEAHTADVPRGPLNPFKQWAKIRVHHSTLCRSPEQQQEIKHKRQRNKESRAFQRQMQKGTVKGT